MHRFFLPTDRCEGSRIFLSERDSHHAIKVLRMRFGDRLIILDGRGRELLCQVKSTDNHQLIAQILSEHIIDPLGYSLELVQALTRGRSMDFIIQKATELGCASILPVFSERCVVQCDENELEKRRQKWESIAIESMKQCGQAYLPSIEKPRALASVLASFREDCPSISLLASLQNDALHPRIRLEQYHYEIGKIPEKISLWIGPEGDFTPAEINAIKTAGALPITLGPLILRSETAALYILSTMNYELQSPSFHP